MDKRSLKIFIACALGAGIGSLVALEMQTSFWWIGLLVGGFVGYISYDFKKVVRTIPKAYKKAKTWKESKPSWQRRRRWKVFKQGVLIWVYFLLSFAILLFSIGSPDSFFEITILAIQIFTFMFFASLGFGFYALFYAKYKKKEEKDENEFIKEMKKRINPFRLYFYYLPKGIFNFLLVLLKGIIWCLKKSPGALFSILKFIGKFSKELFFLIHSDIRLLCGIDAALGASIGYFTGNVIIGMMIGGLLGLANYELISKRVLKLVHN